MTRRTIAKWLIVFSIVALAARVWTIFHLRAWQLPNAIEHRSLALSLVNKQGFSFGEWGYFGPSSVQSPTFPFLLAGMFKIFGHDAPADGSLRGANLAYLTIMLINALLGVAMVWLTYSMARTLGATTLAAVLAAGAVAVWPSQVYAVRHVQAIVMISCCLAAMNILFYLAVRSGGPWHWAAFAAVAAVATLTEPVFLPSYVLIAVMVLFWRGLPVKLRWQYAGISVLAAFVVIGPWSVRNRIVHEKWMPIKGTFWVNVWKGNNDFATGTDRIAMSEDNRAKVKSMADTFYDDALLGTKLDGERQYVMLDPSQMAQLHNQPEIKREEVFKKFALSWIHQHPRKYMLLCAKRLVKTLTVDWDNPKSENTIYQISRFVLLGLSIAGLVVALRQKWSLLYPAVVIGTALATYTLTVTAARFSIPFEPLQLCLGAGFVSWIFETASSKNQKCLPQHS